MSWTRALYFGVAIVLVVVGVGGLLGQYFGGILAAAIEAL
jgi:hypothetical protein